MAVITEKKVLIDVLKKFRDLSYLWDQSHELYGNKVARKEGFHILLDIYKTCDPDMNVHEFKKKLENMRTTYRRERVKVLKSQMNGEEYMPSLWYYKYYTFLDDIVNESTSSKRQVFSFFKKAEKQEMENMEESEEEYLESDSNSPRPKKKKKQNRIFLTEGDIDDPNDAHSQEESYVNSNEHNCSQKCQKNLVTLSTELVGKTTGQQLSELKPLQRIIAEKLISEVIFYARLEKLRPDTKLTNYDE